MAVDIGLEFPVRCIRFGKEEKKRPQFYALYGCMQVVTWIVSLGGNRPVLRLFRRQQAAALPGLQGSNETGVLAGPLRSRRYICELWGPSKHSVHALA